MMQNIKCRFANTIGIDSFQRVDSVHILDLYLGIDNMSKYTLFLISEIEPRQVFSSQLISVAIGLRKDNKWGMSFSLVDSEFEDVFCHFCTDIIESSRGVQNKNKGTEYICRRYIQWQNMLSKYKGGLLSPSAIKGLIGELLFLKEYMIPLYGEEKAVNSWIGPEKAAQDFVCENTWYEVKSSISGAESVRISSVEQMDTLAEGELVIVFLDKTSIADNSKITLNGIFNMVINSLTTEELRRKLRRILLNLGYYERKEYDEYQFKFSHMNRYQVNKDFPCVRREKLPDSVINLKYELSLPIISNYLKG